MKFKFNCILTRSGDFVNAVGNYFLIQNVLLADGVTIDEVSKEHNFVVVVNKRGQLTVLCLK